MRGASLTRRVRFHATHRYWRPEWDEARNNATFGTCAAPEPHGHEYSCDVTVAGAIDAKTGMVIDLSVLDRVLVAEIVTPLHGRSLNDAIPEFAPGGRIPTCEEVARIVFSRVTRALAALGSSGVVESVRVAEDDTLSATWTREG
jgi:6-pyruvoyltetrahydropterin/6-carboxytetrahydropterin synthase